jgi:hypothetical protein
MLFLHGATCALQAARTETAPCSCTPSFRDATFLLQLPRVLGEEGALPQPTLTTSLFAAPSLDAPAGPIHAGG